jgi:hypothetical protein
MMGRGTHVLKSVYAYVPWRKRRMHTTEIAGNFIAVDGK